MIPKRGEYKMKIFSVLILGLFLNANSFAFSYGKFKVSMQSEFGDTEEVTFLLNSSGNFKFLENEDYYSIDSSQFFDEITLDIQSGGDEDFMVARVVLKDNKVMERCASFVDAKNEYLILMGPNSFKFERWNKFTKAYELLKGEQGEFSDSCFDSLLAPYPFEDL
jgi:hypothetical protein